MDLADTHTLRQRVSTLLTKSFFTTKEKIKMGILPQPRDGQTVNTINGSMIVFGGDRNKFPFNDLFFYIMN